MNEWASFIYLRNLCLSIFAIEIVYVNYVFSVNYSRDMHICAYFSILSSYFNHVN